jgi:hypothetical protein
MHMRLYRVGPESGQAPPEERAARDVIKAYNHRFRDFYKSEAHTRVPTTLRRADQHEALTPDVAAFLEGRHSQLLGPSGCGKSLLAKHLALAAPDAGKISIVVPAKEYEGRLSTLLDRSIAHLHPDTAMSLLSAASRVGVPVGLVVDGFNECPTKLRKSFIKDLQAFYLRWRVTVLVTSQDQVDLPEALTGERLTFQPLTPEEKTSIVRTVLGREPPEDLAAACLGFQSAFELNLLADCCTEVGLASSRAELFETYVRRRSDGADSPAVVRRILAAVAGQMRRRLVSSLTMAEVWRIATNVLEVEGGRSELVSAALKCGLVDVRQGRCSFRHEMLELWFQAESLIRTTAADSIGKVLARPRNRALAEFVLAAEPDEEVVRQCLEGLAESSIVTESLLGRYGEVVQRVAHVACMRLLEAANSALASVRFELIGDQGWRLVHATGGPDWSKFDWAVMGAVGEAVARGQFLDDYLRLVRATEETVRWAISHHSGGSGELSLKEANAILASLFVMRRGDGQGALPASAIFHAIRFGRIKSAGAAEEEMRRRLNSLVREPEWRLPGELYVITGLVKWLKPDIGDALPALVKAGWSSGLYHLRLEVLQLAQWCSDIITGPARDELVAFLSSLNPKNFGLSTSLVDALMAYDMVESPVTRERAKEEVREILAAEEDATSCVRAYGVVSSIFEDIYQGAYYEAIEVLTRDDRIRLLTRAALGAPDYGFSTDWILRELVMLNDAIALPAFRRWAVVPSAESVSPQDATARMLAAIAGCAQHLGEPPTSLAATTEDERAWKAYATIYFWLNKPGLAQEVLRERSASEWATLRSDLAFQAVDPLHQFERSSFMARTNPLAQMAATFPVEMRSILEFGLRHHSRLTSLFGRDFHGESQPSFIVGWLGRVGNSGTIEVLEPHIDSPDFGVQVTEVIKTLKAGSCPQI